MTTEVLGYAALSSETPLVPFKFERRTPVKMMLSFKLSIVVFVTLIYIKLKMIGDLVLIH
ncbi:hypothetical protein OCUAc20_20450 [Acinetobacter baumannii]|nr:putative oxidoreductase zinc-binding protein [Acinetobacter baumannii 1457504]BDE23545.1 hypothetical protein OCUAc20_20450 [Acinetobacter baumannii]